MDGYSHEDAKKATGGEIPKEPELKPFTPEDPIPFSQPQPTPTQLLYLRKVLAQLGYDTLSDNLKLYIYAQNGDGRDNAQYIDITGGNGVKNDDAGGDAYLTGGDGFGTGRGAMARIDGGRGGSNGGFGGSVQAGGGFSTGEGGTMYVIGGASSVDGKAPGNVYLYGGTANAGNTNGGDVVFTSGPGSGTGKGGNYVFQNGEYATTANAGFPVLPYCVGTPTGSPVYATGCMILDSNASKLWINVGGTWKYAQLT